jgi:peroxiredoxin
MNLFIERFLIICFLVCVSTNQLFAQEKPFALKMGEVAPNFTAKDQDGQTVELYKILEKSPVVLIFYRGAWCPYCNKQLSETQDSLKFIHEKGGVVIAVTPEQPESIDNTIKKTNTSFKIIHDKQLKIMKSYKVNYTISDALLKEYGSVSKNILNANKENGANLPVPATYIIGTNKKVLYAFFDPDFTKRATVGDILKNI